jgi:aminobenzoyl-glutamate utilization protein B
MRNTEEIWRLVDERQEPFIELSDTVWGMPELAYTEPARSPSIGRC